MVVPPISLFPIVFELKDSKSLFKISKVRFRQFGNVKIIFNQSPRIGHLAAPVWDRYVSSSVCRVKYWTYTSYLELVQAKYGRFSKSC